MTQLGTWAQRWFRTKFVEHELDAGVLMWDIRCTLDPDVLSDTRTAVQFVFSDVPQTSRNWWLVNQNGELDLCPVDPGFEVGMIIRTTLDTMTRVWMGDVPLTVATRTGQLEMLGSPAVARRLQKYFCLSPYACVHDARKEIRAGQSSN